jgi:rhodanese-related sulfurtransferase
VGLLSWILGLGLEHVSPGELKEKLRGGGRITLLDVRTPEETARGTIGGAKLIPLQELGARHRELPDKGEVVVYCASGLRSVMATRMLRKLGHTNVKNMRGGYERW